MSHLSHGGLGSFQTRATNLLFLIIPSGGGYESGRRYEIARKASSAKIAPSQSVITLFHGGVISPPIASLLPSRLSIDKSQAQQLTPSWADKEKIGQSAQCAFREKAWGTT
jgi:hypothetical protein